MRTIVLAGLLFGLSCSGGPSARREASLPHVVVILADDMGYGDPGCYNPRSKSPTPHVDALAAAGMRFTDAHAPASWCVPSRYGLLTGRYPMRTSLAWRRQPVIPEGEETLGALLRGRGYATAMVGKWHLGFEEGPDYDYAADLKGGPVDRGFDRYFGIPHSLDIVPYYTIRGRRAEAAPTGRVAASSSPGWSPIQGAFWRAGPVAPGFRHEEILPRLTDEAVAVIRDHDASRPLFLYFALPSPHTPWLPTAEFRGSGGAGMYGEFVAMTDAMVGRVLKALEEAGMAENALVLFTSDNGPVWYDADVERFGHDSSGGWRGMKGDAWEAGHRMPFVVRWPGHVAPGSVSDRLVNFTDVMATVAELTGAEAPAGARADSVSFLPTLRGADQPDRPATVTLSSRGYLAVRRGRWKLIDGLGSGGFSKPARVKPKPGDPAGQLYDLSSDPGETKNRHAAEPGRVKELAAEVERLKAVQ